MELNAGKSKRVRDTAEADTVEAAGHQCDVSSATEGGDDLDRILAQVTQSTDALNARVTILAADSPWAQRSTGPQSTQTLQQKQEPHVQPSKASTGDASVHGHQDASLSKVQGASSREAEVAKSEAHLTAIASSVAAGRPDRPEPDQKRKRKQKLSDSLGEATRLKRCKGIPSKMLRQKHSLSTASYLLNVKATTSGPVADKDAVRPTDSSRSPDVQVSATGQATVPLPSQANNATASLVPIDIFCGQVPTSQPQHQTLVKEAPATQHACKDQQSPAQPAVASLKPVVPLKHLVVATASKLDRLHSKSATPATCIIAGNNNVSHDQQQSHQQQQPVSGEKPQAESGISFDDSPDQHVLECLQFQHSELSQAQHTSNSQAENDSSVGVLNGPLLDSPQPSFAATDNSGNPAATEDCGGAVSLCRSDATHDTVNQEEAEGHAMSKPDSAQQVLGINRVCGHQIGASPTACDQQVQELQSQKREALSRVTELLKQNEQLNRLLVNEMEVKDKLGQELHRQSTLSNQKEEEQEKVTAPAIGDVQVSGATSEVLANQIGTSLDNFIAKLHIPSAPSSTGVCDEDNVEHAEAVIKAHSLSAAASLEPMGSSVWCEQMQTIVKLMGELAVPQQQLHQAREAFHQAKQKTLVWNEKSLIELKAHRQELLRFLSLCVNSNSTAQQSMQSAHADVRQLEARHAIHQRVCAIVQAKFRQNTVSL